MAKQNINFEIYERANKSSTIDWGKQAQDITKTFTDIRDDRQKRKDEIEKAYQEQQELLANQDLYNNYTLNQLVMNAAQDGSHKLQDQYELVKKGLVKPADLKRFQMNQKTGFTQLKKNAENFDKAFKNYTNRQNEKLNATSSVSKGSPLEAYSAELLSGFANINNMVLETDAVTGNLGLIKLDKNGNPIAGKSSSVNGVSNLMNQQIDNFDANQEAQKIKKSFGNIITSNIRGATGNDDIVITETMRSRAETEYFATPEGKKYLDLQVRKFTEDPTNKGNMILNAGLTTPSGEAYKYGSQEDYDKYAQENPGKENPVIVAEVNDINVMMPKFDEKQEEAAKNYATDLIQSTLDVKETKQVKIRPGGRAAGKADDKIKSAGNNVNLLVTGNPDQAESAARYLVDASNGTIQKIKKTGTGFEITYTGRDPLEISTEGLNSTDAIRRLYKAVNAPGEFDEYRRLGGKIGQTVTFDEIEVFGAQKTRPGSQQVPEGLGFETFFSNLTDADAGRDLSDILKERKIDKGVIENEIKRLVAVEGFMPPNSSFTDIKFDEDNETLSYKVNNQEYTIKAGDQLISDIYDDIRASVNTEIRKANKAGGGRAGGFNKGT